MIRKIPSLFFDKLRLSKPWRYKAPFLISIPYLFIHLGQIPAGEAAFGLLMSCCTIFGIAGFGYLMNDLSDRAEDQKAGKFNLLISLPTSAIVGLLLLFLACAILPWLFYFPQGWSTLGLLAFELLLFLLYSLPPFRFKERGFLGVLCDAGYAHAVPAVLAALTFFYLGNRSFPSLYLLVGALGFWQGMLGIRNILLHQLGDLEKDKQTETKTFGTQLGKERLEKFLLRWIVPLELLGFLAFTAILTTAVWWFSLFAAAYFAYLYYRLRVIDQIPFPKALESRLSSTLDDFTVLWFPLFPISLLIDMDAWFLLLLPLHVLLFRNGLVETGRQLKRWTERQRVKWALAATLVFLFAQGIFAGLRGDFSTSLVFPLYTSAPAPGEPMQVAEYALSLHAELDSMAIRAEDLFYDLPGSAVLTVVHQNLGFAAEQQNQALDWRLWLGKRAGEVWPEGEWGELRVWWTLRSTEEGEKGNVMGMYSCEMEKGGRENE